MKTLLIAVCLLSACSGSNTADDNQGSNSDVGPAGPQGQMGLTGLTGETGKTGDQGPPGIQGVQGVPGLPGEQGIQGPIGETGATGAASTIPGPPGSPGATGATGATGAKGAAGTNATQLIVSTTSVSNTLVRMGIYVSSTSYMTSGDQYFGLPDGFVVTTVQTQTLYFVGNSCQGAPMIEGTPGIKNMAWYIVADNGEGQFWGNPSAPVNGVASGSFLPVPGTGQGAGCHQLSQGLFPGITLSLVPTISPGGLGLMANTYPWTVSIQ